MPFGEYHRGNFNILAKLGRRMPAHKKAVEKRGLALREVQVQHRLGSDELGDCSHIEIWSLPKTISASSGTTVFLTRAGHWLWPRGWLFPGGPATFPYNVSPIDRL